MKRKITVGVLFGGRSAEHEVSLRSARTVVSALDPAKYSVVLIGLDRSGKWFLGDSSQKMLQGAEVELGQSSSNVALTPTGKDRKLFNLQTGSEVSQIDVLFPVLHGPYGEDGTIQGLAKLADVACVGAGVLGSAVGMDKDVMKRLLRDAGIPIGKFVTVTKKDSDKYSYSQAQEVLGNIMFIKPANLGSSVGVTKASTKEEFDAGLATAFKFDRKVIIEELIQGKEIECSVLGNDLPEASVPGEIVPHAEFYSYDAKYSSSSESECKIPANLTKQEIADVQKLAIKTFQVLECRGMARVDFFYTKDAKFLVNEINTIPGFTSISMYPKMWEASGLSLSKLVDRLIQLALEDFEDRQQLLSSPATA